jgi:predicted nuclease of restriction endonuclease-like (RecB) superfamily
VQRGEHRAEYGEAVIRALSEALTARFGRGFSISNIQYFRQFYIAFADRSPEIGQSSVGESRRLGAGRAIHPSAVDETAGVLVRGARLPARYGFSPALSWGHYRTLAKVEQADARLFYEIEAERAGWSVVDLERQIHTQLFARLRKSRDKAGVMDLVTRGLALHRPMDAIRDPYVLDFLDLPDAEQLHESDLEAAIIDKLQHFLLELGKGFAFVGRQKRLEYDDERFYVDLVFYNCVLKCFLLIDLKMGKLTHQDVGQMDSYVRLYDGLDERGRAPHVACAAARFRLRSTPGCAPPPPEPLPRTTPPRGPPLPFPFPLPLPLPPRARRRRASSIACSR